MATLGRPRAFDREAALHAAMLVFWQKGFLATSMTDLCDAMDIRSPSLYAAFGSKEDLYVEAVQRYHAAARPRVWDHIKDGDTARDGVLSLLTAAVEVLRGGGGAPTGCMVNLAVVGDECPEAVSKVVKDARHDGLKMIRARIKRAVTDQELPRSTNIEHLSRFYLGIIQGISVQARDGASRSELMGMAEMAMAAWPG